MLSVISKSETVLKVLFLGCVCICVYMHVQVRGQSQVLVLPFCPVWDWLSATVNQASWAISLWQLFLPLLQLVVGVVVGPAYLRLTIKIVKWLRRYVQIGALALGKNFYVKAKKVVFFFFLKVFKPTKTRSQVQLCGNNKFSERLYLQGRCSKNCVASLKKKGGAASSIASTKGWSI